MIERTWADLLDPDEEILWQGRPDGGFALGPDSAGSIGILLLLGALFCGLMWFAPMIGGIFWIIGLVLCSATGVALCIEIIRPTFIRRHSWYSLTTKRALIATDLPLVGKRLKSYHIGANTPLRFIDATFATIYFATKTVRSDDGDHVMDVGFTRIKDGEDVYGHLRDVQEGRYVTGAK